MHRTAVTLVRGLGVLLLVVPLMVAIPAERAASSGEAVPGTDPADAACFGLYTAPIDCGAWWEVLDPLDPSDVISRSGLMRIVGATLVEAGTPLHAPTDDLFADDQGHPDEPLISALAVAGIVEGTTAMTVDPESAATRGQLATLAERAAEVVLGEPIGPATTTFTDISASVHRTSIERAAGLGLVEGYDPTRFGPNDRARVGQVATVVTRLLGVLVAADVVDPPASTGSFEVAPVPTKVATTIPGQVLVLLVRSSRDDEPTAGTVALEVTAPGATVSVSTSELGRDVVAEVTIVPEPGGGQPESPEAWIPVTVTGTRGTDRHQVVVPVRVVPGEDTLEGEARGLLDDWVAWLAAARPDLGIGPGTSWTPTITQPVILVVSHYLFFSESWELGLTWHVMIPPYDWTEIYLRPRTGLAPTEAFHLDSRSDPSSTPYEIDPPAQVDR